MNNHMAKALLAAAHSSLPKVLVVDIGCPSAFLVSPAIDLLDNAVILTQESDDGTKTYVCDFDKIDFIQIATREDNLLLSIFKKGD